MTARSNLIAKNTSPNKQVILSATFVASLLTSAASAQEWCPPIGTDPFAGLPFDRGYVASADYAENAQAIDIWKHIFNGYYNPDMEPYDSSTDPQLTHFEFDGDPLPGLDGKIHSGYRRLQTDNIKQSVWDAAHQPNSTRSQLGAWIERAAIHASYAGEREFIVYSVRLDSTFPNNSKVQWHEGLYHLSMISQFKALGGRGKTLFGVYEASDGLVLIGPHGENDIKFTFGPPETPSVVRGEWLRIGLDVQWSDGADGSYRWWGDIDGDGVRNFKPLSARVKTPTLEPGNRGAAMNIGPYHTYDVPTNGRDYSNIEFFRHAKDDPWE